MVVGYFSLFDFGIGRALTKLVAEKLTTENEHQIPSIVFTSCVLMLLLGCAGSIVLFFFLNPIVFSWLKIPIPLQQETYSAFIYLLFSIPIIILSIGLRGVLEAKQRFGIVNGIRIPLGILSFVGPVIVIQFQTNLGSISLVLISIRILACIANFTACYYILSQIDGKLFFNKKLVSPLIRFGGWMTVSNIISPIMVYMDRFLIGGRLSIGAVSFYTTPYEVLTKILIVPRSLSRVLFPVLSNLNVTDKKKGEQIYGMSAKYLFFVMCCITVPIAVFAQDGLTVWLGKEFAQKSTFTAQCLSLGVLINALGQVPFNYLQSIGRPDLCAKIHMIELPFYLFILHLLISRFGINGAAMAWTLRVFFDTLALALMVHWKFKHSTKNWLKIFGIGSFILFTYILLIDLEICNSNMGIKIVSLFTFFSIFSFMARYFLITATDMAFFRTIWDNISNRLKH